MKFACIDIFSYGSLNNLMQIKIFIITAINYLIKYLCI